MKYLMKCLRLIKYLIEYFQVPKHLAVAVVGVSIFSLISAYTAQHVFGLEPCILCLHQRIPYFTNIVFGALAFMAISKHPRLATVFLFLSALVFFVGASLACFHTGIEQRWWEFLSTACGTGILPEGLSVEEIREALRQQATVVRCDEVTWTLFGISLAGYNLMYSTSLGIGVLFLLWSGRKKCSFVK